LRSVPAGLGPAERVRLATRSAALGADDDGLFVTVFHARLDLASGRLRYVDAGHGHCAIRHPDGELVRLAERSLPVGIADDEPLSEGAVSLAPGDALVVFSDGLVEHDERTPDLAELVPALAGGAGAADMVARLMERTPARPEDD